MASRKVDSRKKKQKIDWRRQSDWRGREKEYISKDKYIKWYWLKDNNLSDMRGSQKLAI